MFPQTQTDVVPHVQAIKTGAFRFHVRFPGSYMHWHVTQVTQVDSLGSSEQMICWLGGGFPTKRGGRREFLGEYLLQ